MAVRPPVVKEGDSHSDPWPGTSAQPSPCPATTCLDGGADQAAPRRITPERQHFSIDSRCDPLPPTTPDAVSGSHARAQIGEVVTTIPTIGFNVESVTYKNLNFNVWDLGGQTSIRPYWRCYYANTAAVIFVVDSTDIERLQTAADELSAMLNEEELKDAALLVFANKQDQPGAKGAGDISQALRLGELRDRNWSIMACSAVDGTGVTEGMDWLVVWLSRHLVGPEMLTASAANRTTGVAAGPADGPQHSDNICTIRATCFPLESESESTTTASLGYHSDDTSGFLWRFRGLCKGDLGVVVGIIDDISCQRRRLHQTGWNQRSGRVHTCFTTLIYDLGRIRRVIEDSSAHLCIIDTVKAETQRYTSWSPRTWSTQSTRIVARVSSTPTILRPQWTEPVSPRYERDPVEAGAGGTDIRRWPCELLRKEVVEWYSG